MLQHIRNFPVAKASELSSAFEQTFNAVKKENISVKLVKQLKKSYESRGVSPEPIRLTDWKKTKLRDRLLRGVPEFNHNEDPSLLREDEIDYLIDMIRRNKREMDGTNMIQPVFTKAVATLERLMSEEELCMPHLFPQLPSPSPDATVRLLLRVRSLFDLRGRLLRIL